MGATTVHGSCFCGAVRFEFETPTLFCAHCHCSMCQRAHGAGYVTWVGVPERQFRLTAGDEQLRDFASSDHGTRSFCTECGSSLFCRSTHHPDVVDIVLANLAEPIDRPPAAHVYWSDRASWVSTDDKLPRQGGSSGTEPLA